ncbi:MAG: Rossmann-like and DUF2520 domain-containing protein [Acidimicrobiia bacterium]
MDGVDTARTGALALVGPGRAGRTIAAALQARGWQVLAVAGRSPDATSTRGAALELGAPAVSVQDAARGADLVIVATPDAVIAEVARQLAPALDPDALVIHLSGARGLEALASVPARIGALHPLQTLPSTEAGRARLPGSWCTIAGDPQVAELAAVLELRAVELDDVDRARYHAAACIASNHLVALLDQVERVAPIPLAAFLPLVEATVRNVADLGTRAALTGPVARGDVETVRAHLRQLSGDDEVAYRALARLAQGLARRTDPEMDALLR